MDTLQQLLDRGLTLGQITSTLNGSNNFHTLTKLIAYKAIDDVSTVLDGLAALAQNAELFNDLTLERITKDLIPDDIRLDIQANTKGYQPTEEEIEDATANLKPETFDRQQEIAGILKYIGKNADSVLAAGYPKERLSFAFVRIGAGAGEINEQTVRDCFAVMQELGDSTDKVLKADYRYDPLLWEMVEWRDQKRPYDPAEIKQSLQNLRTKLDEISQSNPQLADFAMRMLASPPIYSESKLELTIENLPNLPDYYTRLCDPAQTLDLVLETLEPVVAIREAAIFTPEQAKTLVERHLHEGGEFIEELLNWFNESQERPNPFANLGLEQSIAEQALKDNELHHVPEAIQDKYMFNGEQLQAAEASYLPPEDGTFTDDEIYFSSFLKEVLKTPESEWPVITGTAIRIFGENTTSNSAHLVRSILRNTTNPEKDLLGITESGQAGILQLRDITKDFMASLRAINLSSEIFDKLEQSEVLRDVFKQAVRYETSEWFQYGDYDFDDILRYHREALNDGRLVSLSEAYLPSNTVEVAKLKSKEKLELTEDAVDRYTLLRNELMHTTHLLEKRQPFSYMLSDLAQQVTLVAQKLHTRLGDSQLSAAARLSIERQQQELVALIAPTDPTDSSKYPLRSMADFERNFRVLAKHDQLHPQMRKMMFAWAMRKNPGWVERVRELSYEANTDDISATREFIEHIVNQETFRDYFTDKHSVSLFRKIVNTKSLEAALLRAQGVGLSNDTVNLQFVPTRGLMLEFSGHIADACWAGTYASIAEKMPNMTAVIIKQNPDDPMREKLVGAGMLIEAMSDDGTSTPLLVVRGLNPLENFINHVSVEQFYERFMEYASEIAESQGRQLAIAIDQQSGMASTNRPVLFNYLSGRRHSMKRIKVNEASTTFNGYDISNITYLVGKQRA